MILRYHGKNISMEELRDVLNPGRDATSARNLLDAARYYGLRGRGVKLDVGAFRHLPKTAILHWSFNHFVIYEDSSKDGINIVDPAVGRRWIPMNEVRQNFTGVALLLEPSDSFKKTDQDSKQDGVRLDRILMESGQWARIMTTSIFAQLLVMALPLLTGTIVDRVVPRADRHLLLVMSIGLVLIVAFHFLSSMIRAHLLIHLRTVTDVRMTLDFLEHLIGLPYAFFQRRSAGDLMMRLNSNVIIRQILTSSALAGLLDGSFMLGYLVLIFIASPLIGALALATVALQIGVLLATRRQRTEINARNLSRQALSQSYQVEMLAGIETLKAMGAEHRAQERWSNMFVDVLNVSIDEGRLAAIVESLSGALRMGAPLLILGIGAIQVLDGKLSLGTMLALNTCAVGIFVPLSNLIQTATQLQLLGSYVERIADVQKSPLEQDRARVRPAGELKGRIELENVSFRYGPLSPLVVKDVSVSIEPGKMVAIVGPSGSGKSTLASLLVGLYPPIEGRILYDGVNLAELEYGSVRRQLGIVTQRTYLFAGSIRENISLSDPDTPLDAIIEAARSAQIHDDIARMPLDYNTMLTDAGGSLSGGQRQRIALARALVRKPVILLLDEATSALDAISERDVQEELAKMECTRIVIAHRLSTIMRADSILVMVDGKLIEQGTHAELMARQGAYAHLVETQLGREG